MDTNLALARLRSLIKNVERESSGTDKPYTLDQAKNVLSQFSSQFAELDEHLSHCGSQPADWDHPYED